MKQHSFIRTVYLYIFALLGLILIIIGGVNFIDMGLKTFVFTKADEEEKLSYFNSMPYPLEKTVKTSDDNSKTSELTSEEKAAIEQWEADYKKQQELRAKINPVVSRRQKSASINLSMILIGLPLYLFHWSMIAREGKEDKN